MGPRAITTRLKRVAQLRDAYLRLAKGQLGPRETAPRAPAKIEESAAKSKGKET
ncbi:MAG TPA: hypothetical protein VEZ11_06455 [Thermoanaerobaculia bacterium]|nr:hypothetical protein [Thermoanaerobaculia bacterium]